MNASTNLPGGISRADFNKLSLSKVEFVKVDVLPTSNIETYPTVYILETGPNTALLCEYDSDSSSWIRYGGGTDSGIVLITGERYDALSEEEKNNGFFYLITDRMVYKPEVALKEHTHSSSDIVLDTDIIPTSDNTINIGSSEKRLASIYAEEVHIGSNTLYINDTPVLGSDTSGNTINIRADRDQSLNMQTTGVGAIAVNSEQNIDVRTTGTSNSITIVAQGDSSNVNTSATGNITNTANSHIINTASTQITEEAPNINLKGSVNVTGGLSTDALTVTGDLTVQGTQTILNTETLTVKDNIIDINKGQTGSGVSAGEAGIKIDRGDAEDYKFIFDETDDMFKMGKVGDLVTVASQDFVSSSITTAKTELEGAIVAQCNNKVDKVTGKGLSTNDFTNDYKSAIDNQPKIVYATCSTAAATQVKEIILDDSDYALKDNDILIVLFSQSNSFNSTADKKITFSIAGQSYGVYFDHNKGYNTGTNTTFYGYANRYVYYIVNATNKECVYFGHSWDNDTRYSNASLGQGYATCSTAAATVAKVASLSSYSLTTGGIVACKFTYDVPASATLNINSKGAKAIYYKGAAIKAGVIKAGDIATFIYNGSQYHLLTVDRDNNTDTKNTAGSTDTSSKIFLVGATSQAANPTTYSDNQVYAQNGQLNGNTMRVAEKVTLQYNSSTQSLDFVFS